MFYSAGESFDARKHLDSTFILHSAGTSEQEEKEDGDGDGEGGGGGDQGGRESDEGGGREGGDQDSALPAATNRSTENFAFRLGRFSKSSPDDNGLTPKDTKGISFLEIITCRGVLLESVVGLT